MPNDKPIYALACAGGGAHGAYQVGVLKYIHEHFCRGEASPFRVFSGTSCGSLNTSFFASRSYDAHTARLELEQMWHDFDVPQYHGNIVRNTIRTFFKDRFSPVERRKAAWSLLDPTYLYNVIAKGFNRKAFERALAEGTTLGACVSSTELLSSRLVWFMEGPAASAWNGPPATAITTTLAVPHVAASCSVPFVFPPVRIGDAYFADGGVSNIHPYGPPLNMGATRILTVATDKGLPDELPKYPPNYVPKLTDVVKMLTSRLGDEYNTDAIMFEIFNYFFEKNPVSETTQELGRVIEGTRMMISRYRPIEIEIFQPSRRIKHSDVYDTDLFDDSFKDKQTSLMFSKEFVKPLIEFGYEDARDRHDKLATFFDEERPQRPSIFSTTDAVDRSPHLHG